MQILKQTCCSKRRILSVFLSLALMMSTFTLLSACGASRSTMSKSLYIVNETNVTLTELRLYVEGGSPDESIEVLDSPIEAGGSQEVVISLPEKQAKNGEWSVLAVTEEGAELSEPFTVGDMNPHGDNPVKGFYVTWFEDEPGGHYSTGVSFLTLAEYLESSKATLPNGAESFLRTVVLYADFSSGSDDPEGNGLIKEDVFEMNSTPAIEDLAAALSEWSGLDFKVKAASVADGNAYVDWAEDSTLVAGLDDRAQKADFHFYDAVSLNWFMMDSLARTIKENFPVETVYYSQGSGQPIAFEDGQGIDLYELPVDQPYEGSAFFVAHADGKGDLTD